MKKVKRKGIIDKTLTIVRGKETSVESQCSYQTLQEIGCLLRDIASKIGFCKQADINVYKTYKQINFDQQLQISSW